MGVKCCAFSVASCGVRVAIVTGSQAFRARDPTWFSHPRPDQTALLYQLHVPVGDHPRHLLARV